MRAEVTASASHRNSLKGCVTDSAGFAISVSDIEVELGCAELS